MPAGLSLSEKPGAEAPAQAVPSPKRKSALKALIRVFTFGTPKEYLLLSIAVIAAIASGVAFAMVNVVLGKFITMFSKINTTGSVPAGFGRDVRTATLYFIYIGIVRLVGTYIYASFFTYVAYHLTRNIRRSYLYAALSQEITYFNRGTAGSVAMQAMSNGKLIQSGIAEKLGLFISLVSTFIAAFVIAFIAQWKLTLITICIIPAILLVIGALSIPDAKIETDILKIQAHAGSYAESIFGGIRTMHAFSLHSRVVAKFDTFLKDIYNKGMKKNLLYGVMFGGEYFAGTGLAFWQGIAMIHRGEVTKLGTVFTVVFSVVNAASTITTIAPHVTIFGRAASAAIELFELIDRESEINPFDPSGDKPESPTGVISLNNIGFSYPTRPDTKVLDEFTFDIPAGKVTALVSLNLSWLRTNIRLVQQEPVLFNGSVYDNIANGLVGTPYESLPREETAKLVENAAKTAFAHEFITTLPQGYDTRIGERGGLLSGGQKQRVAIARSIISEPKILLLDEATSALDPHAEAVVQQALDRASMHRTTIVIAHKLATIRNADNIVVMSKGKIMEQGRHEELIARHGIYAELVHAQDLSPIAATEEHEAVTDEDEDSTPLMTQILFKYRQRSRLPRWSLLYNVGRLVANTPELKIWYLVTLFACTAGAAMFPGQALLFGKITDVFASTNVLSRGNFISLMFFIMAIGCLIVYFAIGWGTNIIAQTLNIKLRKEIFSSVIRQDVRFFDRPENTVGALISHLDSYPQAVLELMGFNVALLVLLSINVIASSVLALVVSWKLGVVGVFATMPPMLLSGYARIRLEMKMDTDMGKRFSASSSLASETITAIRTISSLAIEEGVLARYTNELDLAISQTAPSMFHMMIWFAFTQAVEYFILALGFWWGARLIRDGELNLYQFMVSFMGVYFSGQAAGQLFSFSSNKF
ncbi:hypothetical protein H9Q70_001589 [Fusarium xylarioides]|nr:hypothetical protein H9Q70_001589 [Fusarium xylarioides]KAG5774776.1 hypothetical protein H9Q73_011545 [Fusarium xylarioides]